MTLGSWLTCSLFVAFGCGGAANNTINKVYNPDAQSTVCTSDASCTTFSVTCTKDTDCTTTGAHCVYKITDGCSAMGQCATAPSDSSCGLLKELCGCDGTMVKTGCLYPSGYATGPTTGANFCGDAGSD